MLSLSKSGVVTLWTRVDDRVEVSGYTQLHSDDANFKMMDVWRNQDGQYKLVTSRGLIGKIEVWNLNIWGNNIEAKMECGYSLGQRLIKIKIIEDEDSDDTRNQFNIIAVSDTLVNVIKCNKVQKCKIFNTIQIHSINFHSPNVNSLYKLN